MPTQRFIDTCFNINFCCSKLAMLICWIWQCNISKAFRIRFRWALVLICNIFPLLLCFFFSLKGKRKKIARRKSKSLHASCFSKERASEIGANAYMILGWWFIELPGIFTFGVPFWFLFGINLDSLGRGIHTSSWVSDNYNERLLLLVNHEIIVEVLALKH